ncbi:hypothetical protein RB195_015960 [Necator americanus]
MIRLCDASLHTCQSETQTFMVDNTQETSAASVDHTQIGTKSDEISSTTRSSDVLLQESRENLLTDEEALLEETIREVRGLRPKLMEFMDMFGEQQKQIQYLKEENANIEGNLAEIISVQSTRSVDSLSVYRNNNVKATNKKLRSFAKAIKDLTAQETAVSDTKRICKKNILDNARNELSQAQSIFLGLEDIYQEEQMRLSFYQERNENLRERLLMVQKRNASRAMSGDAPSIPGSSPSAEPKCSVADYCDNRIVANSLTFLLANREPQTVKADSAGDLPDVTFCVKEKEQYRLRFDFFTTNNVKSLQYIHKVSRFRVNVSKKVSTVESYTGQENLHSFVLPPETAPEGLFHRGKYRIKSQVVDENGDELITWRWTLKIIKSY